MICMFCKKEISEDEKHTVLYRGICSGDEWRTEEEWLNDDAVYTCEMGYCHQVKCLGSFVTNKTNLL